MNVVVIPTAVAVTVNRDLRSVHFLVRNGSHCMQGIAMLAFLVLISGDRYIAVKFPLRYREIVTGQRIKKAVAVAWVSTVFGTIQENVIATRESTTKLYALYWKVDIVVTALLVLLCITGITFLYLSIFLETQRQKKRLQAGQLSAQEVRELKKDLMLIQQSEIMSSTNFNCWRSSINQSPVYIKGNVDCFRASIIGNWAQADSCHYFLRFQ
ncbi:hypothetical protein pdam_00019728 [Pocillopora damicornis]|uniref:G-protein coupled receptors family 1 profile domain-containing protein n=1 Tax=Pocillopora damicornis TaxID=46731 RepID=A0A3M6TVS0_POCDA|nr:hypothetical protein pdam_00019728 [Pocillopora damicornis]